jgi:16S rRNA (guanine527-N7)-methyltransferase
LLDASAKRTRFLRQVKLELGLENVEVALSRIQDYDPPFSFDTIITRAFSSLHEFVEAAGRLCAPEGRLLAMKGRRRDSELESLPLGYRLQEVRELVVPGETGFRHLVTVVPADKSTQQ